MKSIILLIPAGTESDKLNVINKQLDITSKLHRNVIVAIYRLFPAAFPLNESTKGAILGTFAGMTENNLNVIISRLIKNKALIKNGKLLSLNQAYMDVVKSDQVVIRWK